MSQPNYIIGLSQKDADRFWEKVAIGGSDECWLWTAATQRGYGAFRLSKQGIARSMVSAHRVAYALANRELDPTLHVLHSCDEPLCCNPAHLSAGTRADNMTDAARKGRMSGPKREYRQFTDLERKAIVSLYQAGLSIRAIARDFDRAPVTIRNALRSAGVQFAEDGGSGEAAISLRAELR